MQMRKPTDSANGLPNLDLDPGASGFKANSGPGQPPRGGGWAVRGQRTGLMLLSHLCLTLCTPSLPGPEELAWRWGPSRGRGEHPTYQAPGDREAGGPGGESWQQRALPSRGVAQGCGGGRGWVAV